MVRKTQLPFTKHPTLADETRTASNPAMINCQGSLSLFDLFLGGGGVETSSNEGSRTQFHGTLTALAYTDSIICLHLALILLHPTFEKF
jgi:hypothetical protein